MVAILEKSEDLRDDVLDEARGYEPYVLPLHGVTTKVAVGPHPLGSWILPRGNDLSVLDDLQSCVARINVIAHYVTHSTSIPHFWTFVKSSIEGNRSSISTNKGTVPSGQSIS